MKRSKEEIVIAILEVCKNPVSKTKIVYSGNLNFRTIKPHMDYLIDSGLLEISTNSKTKMYKTTPKGLEVLERFKEIQDSIEPISQ
jgi:predicted transcriptional regulator